MCSIEFTDVEKARQRRSRIVQTLNVPQRVRLGSSLAAALLNGLFEHPEASSGVRRIVYCSTRVMPGFSLGGS
jgi:hypothetical protein